MKLLFYFSYSENGIKHSEMALVRKHVLFVLGVNPTARDTGEGGGSGLFSQARSVV